MIAAISTILAPNSSRTCAAGKPFGTVTVVVLTAPGIVLNPTTTKVFTRSRTEGREPSGFPVATTRSKPLIVPVYVRYKCSNSSAAHHLPGRCQVHWSLDIPATADSRDP